MGSGLIFSEHVPWISVNEFGVWRRLILPNTTAISLLRMMEHEDLGKAV